MQAYVYFLGFGTPAAPAVANWLRSEMEKTPPDGEYARALIDEAIQIPWNNPEFHIVEEPIWRYLAGRKTWQAQEETVIRHLWPFASKASETFWERAMQATGHNPEKERTLGALLDGSADWRRALPLLQDVARQTGSMADRQAAARTGLRLALNEHDWSQARAFWVEARHGLLESNSVHFHTYLLELALQHNAREDAFDLFADWMRDDYNIFRGRNFAYLYAGKEKIPFLKDLLDLGLRERLQLLYHAMALAYPESHAPQDGLLALQFRPPSESTLRKPAFFERTFRETKPFSLRLKHQDLLSALRRVCEHDHIRYIIRMDGWTASKVTLDLHKVTFDQAIWRILAAAAPSPPLQTAWYDDILVLSPQRVSSANSVPTVSPIKTRLTAHVSAHLYSMDLGYALYLMQSTLGIDYHTKQRDESQRDENREGAIRINLTDVSISRLLEGLLKQHPHPMTTWFQGDSLWLGRKDDAPKQK